MKINQILKFLSGVILFAAAPLYAADLVTAKHEKLTDMTRDYVTWTSQSNLAANIDVGTVMEATSPGVPVSSANYLGPLKWSVWRKEIYKDGAWIVQYYDRLISIKPGFIRGSSLGGVYTTEPVALLADITGFDYGEEANYSYIFPGHKGCFSTPAGSFHLAFTTSKLTMTKCVNGQPNSAFSRETTYKEWTNVWTQNAAKYCGTILANYCFIPQHLPRKEVYGDISRWAFRYGYVASKAVPLGTNGLPADFIELFRWNQQDGTIAATYKDSPPLKLAFYFTPQGSDLIWNVYEITKDELGVAEESWNVEERPATLPEDTLMQPAFVPGAGNFLKNK